MAITIPDGSHYLGRVDGSDLTLPAGDWMISFFAKLDPAAGGRMLNWGAYGANPNVGFAWESRRCAGNINDGSSSHFMWPAQEAEGVAWLSIIAERRSGAFKSFVNGVERDSFDISGYGEINPAAVLCLPDSGMGAAGAYWNLAKWSGTIPSVADRNEIAALTKRARDIATGRDYLYELDDDLAEYNGGTALEWNGTGSPAYEAGPFAAAPAPNAPSSVTAHSPAAGAGHAVATQAASGETPTGIRFYRAADSSGAPDEENAIQLSPDGTPPGAGNTVEHTETGLTGGAVWWYGASAVGAGGESAITWAATALTIHSAPSCSITSPATSPISCSAGAVLALVAEATDADDGDISDSIEWSSSNTDDGTAGALGTGAALDLDTAGLAEGTRTVTATAEDADGGTASDSFSLTIGGAPADPVTPYLKARAAVAPLGGF